MHRVLQAAVEEAHGRAGVYVTRDRVMQRGGMPLVVRFYVSRLEHVLYKRLTRLV